jgi:diguanylate cyclase (GGDEF)-like protein
MSMTGGLRPQVSRWRRRGPGLESTPMAHLAATRRAIRPATRWLLGGSALLALLAVGWIDYATGIELHVFPLYFLLLTVVSLRLGRRAAFVFTPLCTLTWLVSNLYAGMASTQPLLLVANALIMLFAFVFVAVLATSAHRSLERERVLSRTDSLTGLPNGRGFYEAAEAELARAARYHHALTVAYLDVDDFKRVNDELGHSRGDELLVTVGRALRQACRASDVVGRLGGDEFVILYPETGRAAAETALQNLRASVARELGSLAGRHLTVSIGAVSFATPPADIDTLVRHADAVMYEVKSSGKNGLCSVADGDPPPVRRAGPDTRPA